MRGQPGEAKQDVPRSPNRRVLPPESRPGIWAADENAPKPKRNVNPQANANRTRAPMEDTPAGIPDAAWKACWDTTQKCLNNYEDTSYYSDADYDCMRWWLLVACGTSANGFTEYRPEVAQKWGEGWDTKRYIDASHEIRSIVCHYVPDMPRRLSKDYERLAGACMPQWRALFTAP